MIDKELIKKRFKKNLNTYNENAVIQNYISDLLLSKLLEYKKYRFNRILEIGCGTGIFTNKLLLLTLFDELFVNDIVETGLKDIKSDKKIIKLFGDCEKIRFPDNLDLVISNAAFQWIENFEALCKKIYSSLNSKGVLAFTTFEDGNLNQIKEITGKSLNYYKKQDIENILSKNFRIIYSFSETINLEFDSAYNILTHLKLSGVNSLAEIKWTKKNLKEFESKYNRLFNTNDKLILTYKPVYFICVKIDSHGEKENE